MKVSCDVIKDILPLYVENMVSGDTRNLVNQHICDCSNCAEALNAAGCNPKVPVVTDIKPLKNVEKQIRRKKRWTVATAVVISITLLTSIMMFLFVPFWLTAEEAIEYVELMDDGYIKFKTNDLTSGYYGFGTGLPMHNGILEKGTRWRMLYRPAVSPEMNEATREGYFAYPPSYANTNFYYIDFTDGTVEKMLWDGGNDVMTGQIIFPNNAWRQYAWVLETLCYGAAALGVLFSVLSIIFRKFRVSPFFGLPAVFFGGYAVASLIVTSGRYLAFDRYDLMTKLGYILLLNVLFLLSALLLRKTRSIRMHA